MMSMETYQSGNSCPAHLGSCGRLCGEASQLEQLTGAVIGFARSIRWETASEKTFAMLLEGLAATDVFAKTSEEEIIDRKEALRRAKGAADNLIRDYDVRKIQLMPFEDMKARSILLGKLRTMSHEFLRRFEEGQLTDQQLDDILQAIISLGEEAYKPEVYQREVETLTGIVS